jgi:hypothetical protein
MAVLAVAFPCAEGAYYYLVFLTVDRSDPSFLLEFLYFFLRPI